MHIKKNSHMKNIIKSCNQIDEASKATFETGQLSESNIDKLKRVVVELFPCSPTDCEATNTHQRAHYRRQRDKVKARPDGTAAHPQSVVHVGTSRPSREADTR